MSNAPESDGAEHEIDVKMDEQYLARFRPCSDSASRLSTAQHVVDKFYVGKVTYTHSNNLANHSTKQNQDTPHWDPLPRNQFHPSLRVFRLAVMIATDRFERLQRRLLAVGKLRMREETFPSYPSLLACDRQRDQGTYS